MKTFEHKDLWNLDALTDEYNNYNPLLLGSEKFIIENAVMADERKAVQNILCIGCGTGREILPVLNYFPNATVYANDIAEKMMEHAVANFKKWNISDKVKTLVCDVKDIPFKNENFGLVTCFNNVMNFFMPENNRQTIIQNLYDILLPNGALIGMVHNTKGTPQKTAYFLFQNLWIHFTNKEKGDRRAGRKGQKYPVHYFRKKELQIMLEGTGFKHVAILSLNQLFKSEKRKLNRFKSSNNLIFIAKK